MFKGLFDKQLENLAPGVENPGKIVRQRIIYNSPAHRDVSMQQRPQRNSDMDIDSVQRNVTRGRQQSEQRQPSAHRPSAGRSDRGMDMFSTPDFDQDAMAVDPGGRFTDMDSVGQGNGQSNEQGNRHQRQEEPEAMSTETTNTRAREGLSLE